MIQPEGLFYQKVGAEDVEEVIEKTLLGGEIIERLTYQDPQSGESIPKEKDIPFYQLQHRLVLSRIGIRRSHRYPGYDCGRGLSSR